MESCSLLLRRSVESQLDTDRVRRAISALIQYINKNKSQSTNLLEDSAEWIQLFVRYKNTPQAFQKYPVQIELPKAIWNSEDSRICLIISDTEQGKRVKKMEEMLVPQEVTKVISAIDARRLYHDSELKREFCNSYDFFLMENVLKDSADGFLGERFVRLKKMPSLVTLTRSSDKWISAIQGIKSSTQMYCYIHQERCIKVGRSSFSVEEIAKNLESLVKQMMERKSDHGWEEVLQMFLCTGESLRLPIYQTFPDAPIVEMNKGEEFDTDAKQAKNKLKRKRKTTRSTNALKKELIEVLGSITKDE